MHAESLRAHDDKSSVWRVSAGCGTHHAIKLTHLCWNLAHPANICPATGLAAARSAPGLGSPLPHLRRDRAHRCHICTGTGLAAATSTPGLGSPPVLQAPHIIKHPTMGLCARAVSLLESVNPFGHKCARRLAADGVTLQRLGFAAALSGSAADEQCSHDGLSGTAAKWDSG